MAKTVTPARAATRPRARVQLEPVIVEVSQHHNGNGNGNGHGNGICPVNKEKSRVSRGSRIGFDPTIHENTHAGLWGDFTQLRGDFSAVYGNVSGLSGTVTSLRGDLSYVVGVVDGVRDTLTDFHGVITGKADSYGKLPRGRFTNRVGGLIRL